MRILSHEMNREKTNLTILPDIKKESQRIAGMQNRSLSELVERLLEKFIQDNRNEVDTKMNEGKSDLEKAARIVKSGKREKK